MKYRIVETRDSRIRIECKMSFWWFDVTPIRFHKQMTIEYARFIIDEWNKISKRKKIILETIEF